MFRKIVASLLMVEGTVFLAAGLTPGVPEMARTVLGPHPEIVSAAKLGALLAIVGLLQWVATGYGLLCLVGGWGALRNRVWAQRIALAVSVMNLPLLPIFTPLGIAGLIAFTKKEPVSPETETEATPPEKTEKPEPVSHLKVTFASLALVLYLWYELQRFAAGQGLPVDLRVRLGPQWILLGLAVIAIIHELGHLAAGWSLGFRFSEINAGPFTLTQRPGGTWAFHFDWNRITMAEGYRQAVPSTLKDLRANWILMVAAGPAISLFFAMLGVLILVSLPGSPYAAYWNVAAFVVSICAADCTANLLPLGLTDGVMLYHSLFGTRRGKGVLAALEGAMLSDRADRSEGLMDPAELEETRRQALRQMENSADVTGLDVATQRIELARASLRNGKAKEAAAALDEAFKTLEAQEDVPDQVWFRYWMEVFETATARKRLTAAAEARTRALELGERLSAEPLDWETLVPVRVGCARLWMSDGDYFAAVAAVQETRAACPERRSVTSHAVELLAIEAECELRLKRRESAESVAGAAIEMAVELPERQRAAALEMLAQTAVRLSAAGESAFVQPMFAAAVEGLAASASPAVAAAYRTAWAESLYESGKLAESASVLAPLEAAVGGFALNLETLRAQLLLAQDQAQDALAVLNPLLPETEAEAGEEEVDSDRRLGLARCRALRSWALLRSGALEEAMADARQTCDVLMPMEHADAAPALMTLAMLVLGDNIELSEAYVQEGTRLIVENRDISPLAKASRLTELARRLVQVNRKTWAKTLLEQAAKFRGQTERVSPAASTPSDSAVT